MRKRESTRESASGRGLPELPDLLELALTMLRDLPSCVDHRFRTLSELER
jgi:hypothetical protein